MSNNVVLVINSGSSSLKVSVFQQDTLAECFSGLAERLGCPLAQLIFSASGEKTEQAIANAGHEQALALILKTLAEKGLLNSVKAVGHRVVHGGEYFSESVVINDDVLTKIRSCTPLAPLHNPANILGIEILSRQLPRVPQVAVFDTAFHQSMPDYAYMYALPYSLYAQHGVRRYGFHGTSHQYVANRAVDILKLDAHACGLISAHLGNGCSATAVENSQSVDTTMGMTPLEGLVMGTRSGDVDPGIHQFLAQQLDLSLEQITALLNQESGLLGLSERSNDMRTLCDEAQKGNEKASLAINVFCYRLAKKIASLAVSLTRLDCLVFTGGIGENAAWIREKVVAHLASLNCQLDTDKNAVNGRHSGGCISTASSLDILVINTQEEWMIAQDTIKLSNL